MNDDYPLDDVLRAWADTGEERLPAAYLDAALAQIETTRQRGARWAPLEDLIMRFQALAAPVAIVAVLVMAIVALALLTGPPNVGPDATPTPSPSATTAANSSPTPEPTPEATASPTPVPSTSEAATRLLDAGWSVPFTMTVPSNWQRFPGSTATTYILDSGFRQITFTTQGQETVEGWRNLLTTVPELIEIEPEPIVLGTAPGFTNDLRLDPDADSVDQGGYVLFREGSTRWFVTATAPTRLWVVDVAGETVLIVTDAREQAFDGWTQSVEDALATLVWE